VLLGAFCLAACNSAVPPVAERCFALEVGDWTWVPEQDDAEPHDEDPPDISRLVPSLLLLANEPGHDIFGEPVDTESPDRKIVGQEWGGPDPVRTFREVWRHENDRLFLEWSSGIVSYGGEFQWRDARQVWEGVLTEVTDYGWWRGAWTSAALVRPNECPTELVRSP